MRVEVTRSGGLAGGVELEAAADTERLPDPDAARLRDLVQRADVETLARRSPLRGRGADRFQYDLRLNDDAGTHELTASEDAAPPELRELIEWVFEHRSASS